LRFLGAALALVLATCSASADETFTISTSAKMGQPRQLGVYGGHSKDCKSSEPARIEIVAPPRLGALGQRDNVPYVARNSLSHTCEGEHFFGVAVDYTAKAAGRDEVRFDAVFRNGTAHYIYTITNR